MTYHGINGEVYVEGLAVGEVVDWSYDMNSELADDTALGDTARTYVAGLYDGSISVTMHFDPASDQQNQLMIGSGLTCILYPLGNAGAGSYSGQATVESVSTGANMTDIIQYSVSLKGYLAPQ